MGSWGPQLYQDDFAQDIRDVYIDQLKRGKKSNEITKELFEQYEEALLDSDDAPIFWYALADTQWEFGRLEESVKLKALYYIREGDTLDRWKDEGSNVLQRRKQVLSELERKLLTPQPEEKKIKQYKLYVCDWDIGDVYAYQLNSECAKQNGLEGRYFLFHKIGETIYWPGHIIPIVRVKITNNHELPKCLSDFNDLEYVQTSIMKNDGTYIVRGESFVHGKTVNEYIADEFGFLPIYRLALMNTSKRIIPKKLIYVGKYTQVTPPDLEFVPEDISLPGFLWKFFENIVIERYCGYNLHGFSIYSKE